MTKNFSAVYWITGLAGEGKTTVGKLLYDKLRAKKPNIFLYDGDIIRLVANDTDYSLESRKRSSWRDVPLLKMISDQGIDVITCSICMFQDVRKWNRANIPRYKEIFGMFPWRYYTNEIKKAYIPAFCAAR